MGVLHEQSSAGCEYGNWQNGDGINKPKITVTESENGVVASYQGPETGFCIQHSKGSKSDSIHQLAGVVRVIVSTYLKKLYSQGVYVKPNLKGINMIKRNNFFKIEIPFEKTTEDKAITNFNERGGWGHSGADTLRSFLSTIENNPQYGMIDKITKVASGGDSPDITENWVSFRDLKTYPIKGITERSELDEKESGEKWIKCKNCKKKFTQTIHKGKKSLPICPYCGTDNDLGLKSDDSD